VAGVASHSGGNYQSERDFPGAWIKRAGYSQAIQAERRATTREAAAVRVLGHRSRPRPGADGQWPHREDELYDERTHLARQGEARERAADRPRRGTRFRLAIGSAAESAARSIRAARGVQRQGLFARRPVRAAR